MGGHYSLNHTHLVNADFPKSRLQNLVVDFILVGSASLPFHSGHAHLPCAWICFDYDHDLSSFNYCFVTIISDASGTRLLEWTWVGHGVKLNWISYTCEKNIKNLASDRAWDNILFHPNQCASGFRFGIWYLRLVMEHRCERQAIVFRYPSMWIQFCPIWLLGGHWPISRVVDGQASTQDP